MLNEINLEEFEDFEVDKKTDRIREHELVKLDNGHDKRNQDPFSSFNDMKLSLGI